LPDDVARKSSAVSLQKPRKGKQGVAVSFSIPRVADKLNAMGPGDAFVDTDLRLLAQECIDLDERNEAIARAEQQARIRRDRTAVTHEVVDQWRRRERLGRMQTTRKGQCSDGDFNRGPMAVWLARLWAAKLDYNVLDTPRGGGFM
jgi:hypothetical protein